MTVPAAAATTAPGLRLRWRRVRQRSPQWWLHAFGALGWLVLVGLYARSLSGGHAHHPAGGAGTGASVLVPHVLVPHVVAALAMVAVMVPLIAVNVRYAAVRSPRRARGAVTGNVVGGYVLVWVGAAAVLGAGTWLLAGALGAPAAVGLVTAVAVGWQYTRPKRLGLARCDALLAPPLDRRRSGPACRRYGVALGRNCVRSCWPLMALMAVAAHNPLVVAAMTGVAWYERRRRPHHDPGTGVTALVIAATGVLTLGATALLT